MLSAAFGGARFTGLGALLAGFLPCFFFLCLSSEELEELEELELDEEEELDEEDEEEEEEELLEEELLEEEELDELLLLLPEAELFSTGFRTSCNQYSKETC